MSEALRRRGPRTADPGRPTIPVRLPIALDEQVRALALAERRSISAQIEVLIERGLRSYGLEVAAA